MYLHLISQLSYVLSSSYKKRNQNPLVLFLPFILIPAHVAVCVLFIENIKTQFLLQLLLHQFLLFILCLVYSSTQTWASIDFGFIQEYLASNIFPHVLNSSSAVTIEIDVENFCLAMITKIGKLIDTSLTIVKIKIVIINKLKRSC